MQWMLPAGGPARPGVDDPLAARPQPAPTPLQPQVENSAAAAGTALREGRSAVISGSAGTGKSTVMARVLSDLDGEFAVLRLSGAASWSGGPFSGLFWLLSELPPEALANPVHVLQFVRGALRRKADGRTLVLAVENAEDLDVSTTAVLLQLCRAGCALMLATVRDRSSCSEEFARWCTDASVHSEELGPLGINGTRELLEVLSGGPVSSRLAAEVHERSQGNPLLTSLFFQEQLEAGTVLKRRGTWVWTGTVSYAGALAERVESETGVLSAPERYAVDALALTGGLALPQILRIGDSEAVERLEETGLADAVPGPVRMLRLKDPLLAEAAAALVPHSRAQEIRSRVAAAGSVVPADGRVGHPSDARAEGEARRALALCRAGNWGGAADAARVALELVLDRPGAKDIRGAELLSELFAVLLHCGELRLAADLLAHTDARAAGLELRPGNDLCRGVVQVLAGQADRAVNHLERALAQFEEDRAADLIPLATSAAAYAHVLLDGDGGPVGLGSAGSRNRDAAEGFVRSLAGLHAAGSLGPDPAEGISANGPAPAWHLLPLALSALQGVPGAAGRLGAQAAGATGPAADMYADLAGALAGPDRTRMLHAAQAAYRLGHYLLGYEAASRAARFARTRSDRAEARAARRIENTCFRLLLAANTVSDRLPELSEFERRLAFDAAAGESSAHLAAQLHLSPRTVDWHLGRIFTKLRVSGRTDLRECLEAEHPNAWP